MSNLVTDTVLQTWRSKRKTKISPSGWYSGDAVCCDDRRGRGGLRLSDEGGWVWHCFNCQFKTSWRPGKFVSDGNKRLLQRLGLTDQQITEIGMEALRLREAIPSRHAGTRSLAGFKPQDLPAGCQPMLAALQQHANNQDLLDVCEYVLSRRLDPERYYWTPESGMSRRFVIPFLWQGRTVGWTARAVDAAKKPKYLSQSSAGYVYGLDQQDPDNQYLIVSEGVLDADSCGGCAVLGNNISQEQQDLLEATDRKIIWVPDRDADGMRLAAHALSLDWMVSIPYWDPSCKDINDAVILYGRAATLVSILSAASYSTAATMLKINQIKNRIQKTA